MRHGKDLNIRQHLLFRRVAGDQLLAKNTANVLRDSWAGSRMRGSATELAVPMEQGSNTACLGVQSVAPLWLSLNPESRSQVSCELGWQAWDLHLCAFRVVSPCFVDGVAVISTFAGQGLSPELRLSYAPVTVHGRRRLLGSDSLRRNSCKGN